MRRAQGWIDVQWGFDRPDGEEVVLARRRVAWGPRRGGGPWGWRRRLPKPRAVRYRDMRPAATRWRHETWPTRNTDPRRTSA